MTLSTARYINVAASVTTGPATRSETDYDYYLRAPALITSLAFAGAGVRSVYSGGEMIFYTFKAVDEHADRMMRTGSTPATVAAFRVRANKDVRRRYKAAAESSKSAAPRADHKHRADWIARYIANAHGLDVGAIFGPRRTADGRVTARRQVAYACVQVGMTFVEIAAYLRRPGKHSTVCWWLDRLTEAEKALPMKAMLEEQTANMGQIAEDRHNGRPSGKLTITPERVVTSEERG